MDELQGSKRWERHRRYLISLKRLAIPYQHLVVAGVRHDHSLMFNSQQGLAAIFDPIAAEGAAEPDWSPHDPPGLETMQFLI